MGLLLLAAVLFPISAALADPGTAPSFDCAKADTRVLKTICSDPELASADREMANAYEQLILSVPNIVRTWIGEDQRNWEEFRESCDAQYAPTEGSQGYTIESYVKACLLGLTKFRKKSFGNTVYPLSNGSYIIGRQKYRYDMRDEYEDWDQKNFNQYLMYPVLINNILSKKLREEPFFESNKVYDTDQFFKIYFKSTNIFSLEYIYYAVDTLGHGDSGSIFYTYDLREGNALFEKDIFIEEKGWREFLKSSVREVFERDPDRYGSYSLELALEASFKTENWAIGENFGIYIGEASVLNFRTDGNHILEIPYTALNDILSPSFKRLIGSR